MTIEELSNRDIAHLEVDPAILDKAKTYTKRNWSMDIKPMLKSVWGDNFMDEHKEEVIAMQNALLENKIEVLVKSQQGSIEARKEGLLWS